MILMAYPLQSLYFGAFHSCQYLPTGAGCLPSTIFYHNHGDMRRIWKKYPGNVTEIIVNHRMIMGIQTELERKNGTITMLGI